MEHADVRALPMLARRAADDLIENFWTGTPEKGHFIHVCDEVLWELGMGLQALESEWLADHDASLKRYWRAEWQWLLKIFTPDERMTLPDSPHNPACDDAAWSAMTLMSIFRQTGEQRALELSMQTVRRAYDCWKDGDICHGLWYRFGDNRTLGEFGYAKSAYCAGLMLSAIEQYKLLKGDREADRIMDETLSLLHWVETRLRADSAEIAGKSGAYIRKGLYYTDYIENAAAGVRRPAAAQNGRITVRAAGSESALFANTGMAVIHMLLYRVTGDGAHRQKALETANSLALPPYHDGGVLLNDRDAWTNCAFMRYFVEYVLTDEGIDPALISLLLDSGVRVATQCRTEEGLYLPDWNGGAAWKNCGNHTVPEDLKTSATSAHLVTAAHYALSLGLSGEGATS